MVLDSFGVNFCGVRGHAQRDQKIDDDPMPLARLLRNLASAFGKKDGTVRPRGNEPVPLQPRHDLADGNVRDPHSARNIDGARFAVRMDEFRNGFDVILRALVPMVRSRPLVS